MQNTFPVNVDLDETYFMQLNEVKSPAELLQFTANWNTIWNYVKEPLSHERRLIENTYDAEATLKCVKENHVLCCGKENCIARFIVNPPLLIVAKYYAKKNSICVDDAINNILIAHK